MGIAHIRHYARLGGGPTKEKKRKQNKLNQTFRIQTIQLKEIIQNKLTI